MNMYFTFYVWFQVTVMFSDILDRNWCILSFDGVSGPTLIKFAEFRALRPCCTKPEYLPASKYFPPSQIFKFRYNFAALKVWERGKYFEASKKFFRGGDYSEDGEKS